MLPYPERLHGLAWIYLSLSLACAATIIEYELRRPQKLWIMNFVWPLTALYGGPVTLRGYLKFASKMTGEHMQQMKQEVRTELQREQSTGVKEMPGYDREGEPTREQVTVAGAHCACACTLGGIGAEWWVFAAGLTFAGSEFQTRLLLNFLLAWTFGIVVQYFTIVPMRRLSFGKGLLQAMRADTLSIVSFQIGLFAWMAFTYYVLFPKPHLKPTEAVFWFMMQIGMIFGFITSYPVNILLLKSGWKEKMPQDVNEMKEKLKKEEARWPRAA